MIKPVHVMIGLLVIFIGGVGYAVHSRNAIRPGTEVVTRAKDRLASAQAELVRVRQLPRLPLLDPTWTRTRFFFEACGLSLTSIPPTNQEGIYPGPAIAWHAGVAGDSKAMFACANAAASEFPIIYNTLDVAPGGARMVISVLGQLQELKL